MCSGSDPSPIKPSSPRLWTTVVEPRVVRFEDSEVGLELDFETAALNLFSATCRNLVRVSLEFHWPIRLDKFLVLVVVVAASVVGSSSVFSVNEN